jgi:drug/metabolite transporter (DMT)-like permease
LNHQLLVVVLSLAAAFAFALSSSFKHVSAGHVPDAQSMRPSDVGHFVRATLAHRLWLGGIGCDIVGLALQVTALHLGALAVVQPLLITGLLFALVLRQRHAHHHITGRELVWASLITAALAGFLLIAGTGAPRQHQTADVVPAVIAGVVGAALAVTCVYVGRTHAGRNRAAALVGIAVGVLYAASAALLKALTDTAAHGLGALLASWQLYVLIAVGTAGLLFNQLAFQAGPITASLPATATIDPLLSIVVGVSVYDEHIRRGPGAGTALAALLVLLGVGVFQIVRAAED